MASETTSNRTWALVGFCFLEIAIVSILASCGVDWLRKLPWLFGLALIVGVPLLNTYFAAALLAFVNDNDEAQWLDAFFVSAAVFAIPVLPSASSLDIAIPGAALLLSLMVRLGLRIAEGD